MYIATNAEDCGITEEGVQQIVNMEQLEELAMGTSYTDLDDPAAKTQEAYRAIFNRLRSLEKLEMPEPTLQAINISNRRPMQGGARLEMRASNC